ncbi:hypothetical protein [Nocardia sp. NPDC057455]|uniref:hypothetical protein n=1 Tax=Nocardia sp. NPDC057455 TaxID=3346138 RepID=UPI00366CCDFF
MLEIDVERAELDVLLGISEADRPRIGAVVAQVRDPGRSLGAVLNRHGLFARTRQDPNLRGTELHEIYAIRAEIV